MMPITIKKAETTEERNDCLEIRKRVFIEEQGVSAELEYDDFDRTNGLFLLAKQDNQVVATCRLREVAPYIKIERVAVLESMRGKGIGRLLMEYALKIIRSEFPQLSIKIHAQVAVVDFYQRLGWLKTDKPIFLEDGIEHYEMTYSK